MRVKLSTSYGAARRFTRDRKAATMVEFALVGPLFLALLFGILDIAFVAYAQTNLDDAAASVARELLVGKAQSTKSTRRNYKDVNVCPKLPSFMACNKIRINILPVAADTQLRQTFFDTAGNLLVPATDRSQICPGGPGDMSYVQLAYAMPTFFGRFSPGIADETGNVVLVSGVVVKNEPYVGGVLPRCL